MIIINRFRTSLFDDPFPKLSPIASFASHYYRVSGLYYDVKLLVSMDTTLPVVYGSYTLDYTVVSCVNAHRRSTTTPRFSVYWALTMCKRCRLCGVVTTKRVRVEHVMLVRALYRGHARVSYPRTQALRGRGEQEPGYEAKAFQF